MASVWKRLQRNFKRAAKFQFTASYHDLHLETTAKWRPSNLSIVWTRRSRRVASAPLPWEPDMMNPLVGNISWPVPDNHTISVTLFKDPRTHELEDKDWTFVIEDVTPMGKKRVLANASINMRKYASVESTQQSFTLTLKPVSKKITAASLELTISCVFLREGKATDEDMQSVVSMMSVNNNDVAPLDDLEDIPDFDNCSEITDFTQQLKHLTISLNGCIDLDTPQSEGDGKGDAASKLDLSTATGATGGLSSADESLKTPNGLQPLVDSTPIKSPGEVRQPPKQTPAEPARSKTMETFDKMVTSTPLEPKASKDDAKPKKKRALFFTEKEDEQDLRVTSLKEESGNDSTKKETTKEENKSTKEASSVVVVVVPQSVKRPELQPLNLKKSYEPSPTPAPAPAPAPASVINESTGSQSGLSTSGPLNNSLKPVEKIVLKTNTPGQDLLEWCKEVTKDYHNVKVTNLTTSWRNGMAFCAIIHHFAPELIDMSQLSAHDVVGNCRIAFDAAESLGIPRVIEPREMNMLTVPDKLGVMTYLHQLRAHFTGKQLKIEQIGSTADESSYVIGDYMSDNLSQSRIVFSHPKTLLLHQNSIDEEIMGHNKSEQLSPTRKKDVKNQILNNSKNILDKVMSPTKDKNSINASQHANQSPPPPQEDSLDEGPPVGGKENISKSVIDPQAANRILTRHKLMSEKAKLMMEKLKLCNSSEAIDEERQARLREQARRLILETRVRSGGSVESPTSPTRPKLERTISPIHNGAEEFYLEQSKKLDAQEPSSPSHRLSGLKGLGVNGSPLQSFNAIVDRVSPKHEKRGDKLSYIESELEALEREQEAIDQKASSLEAKLRAVMGGNPSNNRRGSARNGNPILRLIRNSIGGGDVIRIKLLDSDDESLFGGGGAGSGGGGGSEDDDRDTSSDSVSNSGYELHTRQRPRPRSHSCFVPNVPKSVHPSTMTSPAHLRPHHVHHVVPYTHMLDSSPSALSSQQSSCDNLPACSEDDEILALAANGRAASLRRQQDRHRRRRQRRERRERRSHLCHIPSHCETEETEEQLLSQWFTLVNKKNALLRRQMQLNILEQEKDLERKHTMLNQELRAAQSVEDWRKTEVQREKERLLLEELMTIVDKRDQLVQHLHNQEKAIEDDQEIAKVLQHVDISDKDKDKCVLQ
ncbi:EH domain-binding protein 1 isoform X2 [Drosophila subpulchrella]|uniref:EH domain-binding protein 1 isoform X2 n=1 Tax=Drosophila subpulchrella TaxID=1486046 RepID=UPI0018A16A98|nr:EH domain-binding protein 1 isoform X2 [Drosophila subpulchrella]